MGIEVRVFGFLSSQKICDVQLKDQRRHEFIREEGKNRYDKPFQYTSHACDSRSEYLVPLT